MAAQITDQQAQQVSSRSWTTRRDEKQRRLRLVSSWMKGPLLPRDKLVESLQLLIAPGDRIVLEGDNQKQADFLSRSLVRVDPKKIARLAFDHFQHQQAGAPDPFRAGNRKEGRLRIRRHPKPAGVAVARGWCPRNRRHSHLCGAVCPPAC